MWHVNLHSVIKTQTHNNSTKWNSNVRLCNKGERRERGLTKLKPAPSTNNDVCVDSFVMELNKYWWLDNWNCVKKLKSYKSNILYMWLVIHILAKWAHLSLFCLHLVIFTNWLSKYVKLRISATVAGIQSNTKNGLKMAAKKDEVI